MIGIRKRITESSYSGTVVCSSHRNRLLSVTFRSAGGTAQKIITYNYDPFDNLVRRLVDANGDGTPETSETTLYDIGGKAGLEDALLVVSETGAVKTRFLHGAAIDQLFAEEDAAGSILWALADRQGSVTDWAIRSAGSGVTGVVDHVTYDPFGQVTSQTAAAHTLRAGYNGRYTDPDTSLTWKRRPLVRPRRPPLRQRRPHRFQWRRYQPQQVRRQLTNELRGSKWAIRRISQLN